MEGVERADAVVHGEGGGVRRDALVELEISCSSGGAPCERAAPRRPRR
jgi:hypothetical protein